MNILHYIIGILIAVIIVLSISLYKVCADRNDVRRSLRFANSTNDALSIRYQKMKKALFKVVGLKENVPEDCKLGPWCQGCTYMKKYEVFIDHHITTTAYYCGKDKACKHFVQAQEYVKEEA